MKKLIFATGNENKMKEIRMILADCGYEILSMKEAGIQADIVEDGKTFEENSEIKARVIQKFCEKNNIKNKTGRKTSSFIFYFLEQNNFC